MFDPNVGEFKAPWITFYFQQKHWKTCRTSFAKQHSSAKNPFPATFFVPKILFPQHFSRHCVTDAFWMHGFSDPNDFRSKTILLRHQNSKCYFQKPNWNRNLEPPEVFFQEPKPEPPEPFFLGAETRTRTAPFSLQLQKRTVPHPNRNPTKPNPGHPANNKY